jgi:hypothetical protein
LPRCQGEARGFEPGVPSNLNAPGCSTQPGLSFCSVARRSYTPAAQRAPRRPCERAGSSSIAMCNWLAPGLQVDPRPQVLRQRCRKRRPSSAIRVAEDALDVQDRAAPL